MSLHIIIKMNTSTFALLLCIVLIKISGTISCNGYRIKVQYIRNCDSNSIIKVQNLNMTLDKDCNIIPSGCVNSVKRYQTAKVHYVINKPPLATYEGDTELCEFLKTNDDKGVTDALNLFQIPKKCPSNPYKSCGNANKKINISKFKNRLPLIAGTLTAKADVTHDTGVSCIEMKLTLSK